MAENILTEFYGKKITEIKAFGVDEFDFTRNVLGNDFSVGEFGYTVLEFDKDVFYISTDGITEVKPIRENVHRLPVHSSISKRFVGAKLLEITFDCHGYSIKFEGFDALFCRYVNEVGYCDRAYMELEFPFD